MIELDNRPAEIEAPVLPETDTSDDGGSRTPRLTGKMTLLLVLTIVAIAVVVILALIGPVAGRGIHVILSL
jgi:hypothetical protein